MQKLDRLFGDPAPREFNASNHLINIGYGEDTTIRSLAEQIAAIVGFDGPLDWDATKPDGTPRKLLDSQKINSIGWLPSTPLGQGVRLAYADYLSKITDYSDPEKVK
jgi:GDP-L-fucose synthase